MRAIEIPPPVRLHIFARHGTIWENCDVRQPKALSPPGRAPDLSDRAFESPMVLVSGGAAKMSQR